MVLVTPVALIITIAVYAVSNVGIKVVTVVITCVAVAAGIVDTIVVAAGVVTVDIAGFCWKWLKKLRNSKVQSQEKDQEISMM